MDEEKFYDMIKDQFLKMPSMRKTSLFFYDQMMGFYYAVSWSKERWLQALFVLEFTLLLCVIFARRFRLLQFIIFLSITGAIAAAESVNKYAKDNWKKFSTQNYFDEHGVFLGIVYAAPLLVIMTLQLLLTLKDVSKLLVTVKRLELGIDKPKKTAEKPKEE